MVKVALLVRLVAKPGKEEEVGLVPRERTAARRLQAETQTTVWFALRITKNEFGIFDAFPNDTGRKAHIEGAIAVALRAKAAELLAQPPTIEQVDVLAAKLAG